MGNEDKRRDLRVARGLTDGFEMVNPDDQMSLTDNDIEIRGYVRGCGGADCFLHDIKELTGKAKMDALYTPPIYYTLEIPNEDGEGD